MGTNLTIDHISQTLGAATSTAVKARPWRYMSPVIAVLAAPSWMEQSVDVGAVLSLLVLCARLLDCRLDAR
jgi:hypothetical protein